MLTAHHVSKSYGIQPILEDITLSINDNDRLGLVGPNGAGKTTLLRILTGQEQPDKGTVTRTPGDLRVGYLAQGFEPDPERTIAAILSDVTPDAATLERRLAQLSLSLVDELDSPQIQSEYDRILRQMKHIDESAVYNILEALGLADIDIQQPAAFLSGGQKTRLSLVLVLLSDPQLLLLDEPTNHLDIEMLEWLEVWLSEFDGGALIVSHDRAFLDATTTRIAELNPETQRIKEYAGNYTDYLEQVIQEREKQWAAYKDQEYEIRRVRQDIANVKEKARRKEQATKNDVQRRYAKKVAKLATSRENKLERFMASDERVERPKRDWQLKVDFDTNGYIGQDVVELVDAAIGYTNHAPLLTGLNLQLRAGQRVVVTGPNGAGKTTLLKSIAGWLPPLAGTVRLGSAVKMGFMTQEQELIDPSKSAVETLQDVARMSETEIRNFLHFFLFKGDDPVRPAGDLSFGERARLILAFLVAQGCNFLMLDEPINHLDIPSRTCFEEALSGYEGTVLAVVHDRYFINRFATDVWWVEGGSVSRQILPSR